MNELFYFARSSDETAEAIGRLLGPVFLYFIVMGVIRLVTKKPLTKKQWAVTAVVIVVLVILSALKRMSQS